MVKAVTSVGEIVSVIRRNELGGRVSQELEVGGKVRATLEDLQQLSRYNREAVNPFKTHVRHFSDSSF